MIPAFARPSVSSRQRPTASSRERPRDLVAAGGPAAVEVRGAAIADRPDARLGVGLRLGRGERRRDDDVDVIVVGHDGEAVLGPQRADALDRGLAGLLDLVAGHGAGAVEDEREVDGDAVLPRRGLGRGQLDSDEAAAARLGPDQSAVGAHGEAHEPSLTLTARGGSL